MRKGLDSGTWVVRTTLTRTVRRWCIRKSIYWLHKNMISAGRITRASGKLSGHSLWGNRPWKEERSQVNKKAMCTTPLGRGDDAEVPYYCAECHKGLWYNENVNILWSSDFLELSLFIHACVVHLFSETMFPRLATGAQNMLFPANLATPGNITGNNVSATKFPSLARPLACERALIISPTNTDFTAQPEICLDILPFVGKV